MKKQTLFSVMLLAAILLIAVMAWPVAGQERTGLLCAQLSYDNCVESWSGADISLYSDSGATQKINLDGANGDITLDGTLNIDDTAITISGAQTVTPTASVLVVAPSVASTITLATGSASAGDFLLVLNTVATNTNIVDTGATAGGGAIDLGLNDNALFIFLNSKWVEIASPDNS